MANHSKTITINDDDQKMLSNDLYNDTDNAGIDAWIQGAVDGKIGAHQVAVVADMDASDTAYVQIASHDDSSYTVRGTRQNTFFSGILIG